MLSSSTVQFHAWGYTGAPPELFAMALSIVDERDETNHANAAKLLPAFVDGPSNKNLRLGGRVRKERHGIAT